MHVVHLPRHVLAVTIVAALLTVTVMALLLLPAGRLAPASRAPAAAPAPPGTAPAVTSTHVRPPFVARPTWMTSPLAPPDLGLQR